MEKFLLRVSLPVLLVLFAVGQHSADADLIGKYRYPGFSNLTIWPLVAIEVLNGSLPWADDLTGPDGFVEVYVGDKFVGSTETLMDAYYPVWNYKTRAYGVDWEEPINFKVIDYDYMSGDDTLGVATITLKRVLSDGLNGRKTRLTFPKGSLTVRFSVVTVPSCGFNQPRGLGWRFWVGNDATDSSLDQDVTNPEGGLTVRDTYRLKRAAVVERSGRKATHNEFPWHVSLQRIGGDNLLDDDQANGGGLTRHFCSATILNNNYILAAAQCVIHENAGDLMALVGSARLNGRAETGFNPIKYKISSIRVHPHYNNVTKEYDLAVLRTEDPMEFLYREYDPENLEADEGFGESKTSVNALCIMPEIDLFGTDRGRVLSMSAWDSKSAASGREEHLRKIDLMTLDPGTCEARIKLLRRTQFTDVKGFICATGVMKQEEHADIGTSLTRNIAGRSFLYGTLASHFPHVRRHQDGQFVVPALFTNIVKQLNWIESIATDFKLL